MPLYLRLQERVEDAGLQPELRLLRYPRTARDLIALLKADPLDILREPVGILPDQIIELVFILCINLSREIHGDPVALEENHRILHVPPGIQRGGDIHRLLPRDPPDLRKPLRLLRDDPHGLHAELLHDPGGRGRPDPLHRPGAKIPLQRFLISGRLRLIALYDKLKAVDRVLRLMPLRPDRLPGRKG